MQNKIAPESDEYAGFEKLEEIRKRRKIIVYERCPENHNNSTIFFYHGAGGTYRHFKCQISHLLQLGYRVVTCDMFGHGKSKCSYIPETHMFSFEQFCYDALSLFDKFSVDCNNVLIGHSYGTSLCSVVCTERRTKVLKVVLISGGGPYALSPETFSLFSLPTPILSCIRPIILKIFRNVCFRTSPSSTLLPDSELLSIEMTCLQHVMQGQKWDEGDEAYHALISCPVLLMVGKHDKFSSIPDEISMNRVLPKSVLHILDGGHMLPIDKSLEVNDIITSFLINDWDTHMKKHDSTICKKGKRK